MRKLLCLLITIIMAFAAVTAFADSGLRSAELVGKWYAVFELDESVIDLKSNGFLTISTGDIQERGSWYLQGKILHIKLEKKKEQIYTYTGADGYFMDLDTGVILTRNSCSSFVIPEGIQATELSQFNGDWYMTKAIMLDTVLTPEAYVSTMKMMGVDLFKNSSDIVISINNGVVKLFYGLEAQQCNLVNGRLVYTYEYTEEEMEDDDVIADEDYVREPINDYIYLTADNTLVYESEGMVMLLEQKLE